MKAKLVNKNIENNYGRELLEARGVEDVQRFMMPTEDDLSDFRDLDNIWIGVQLIDGLLENAKIGLLIDCDVDGYTSSSIIYQYLKRLKPALNIKYYIHQGKAHGLEEHWQEMANENFSLVIVPDAGSNDSEYAERMGCPILVIDHHILEGNAVADNMVVINNQCSPNYKNKRLSGAGMAYQFCRAMDQYFGLSWADDYIDLAALGVVGDMMSGLEIENQYLWRKGFSNVKNFFFWTLLRKQAYSIAGDANASDAVLQESLDPTAAAFYIAPLINAMVRVGTMEEKDRMFLAFVDGHKLVPCLKRGAAGTMEQVAIESARECTNARAYQNRTKEKVVNGLELKIQKKELLDNEILFLRLDESDDFPAVLNGLIAMQLSQKYKKPTIVARLNNEGYTRGSIRGLSNSELTSFKDYLNSTGLFEYVQGHDNARGCSIKDSYLDKLHEQANHDLAQYNLHSNFYEVNLQRKATDTDLIDIIFDLDKYKFTWSRDNPEPLILVESLFVTWNDIQILGKKQNTLKITKNGISYMKFFATDLIEELKQYDNIRIDLVGKGNVNEWRGMFTPQIFIEDCEIEEVTPYTF